MQIIRSYRGRRVVVRLIILRLACRTMWLADGVDSRDTFSGGGRRKALRGGNQDDDRRSCGSRLRGRYDREEGSGVEHFWFRRGQVQTRVD